MSKTDKTDPDWVKAFRNPAAEIDHGPQCEYSTYSWARGYRTLSCDIDLARYHDSSRPRRTETRTVTNTYYAWTPDEDPAFTEITRTTTHTRTYPLTPGCQYRYYGPGFRTWWVRRSDRRKDCHNMWYAPSRREERDTLGELAKEYRANGEVDHVELEHQQHRHGIGWWD